MKLRETEFFHQFTAVVSDIFLTVMTYAFVQIPLSLDSPLTGLEAIGMGSLRA